VMVAFSANPEDYTNRGNIITPLKDRIDSQIITHYPRSVDVAREITRQEAWAQRQDGPQVGVPEFFRDLVEWVAFEARESEYVDQKSGVSTRMTITAMEQMLSAAEQRALRAGEARTGLRITDLYSIVPALTGKLELVYEGEQEGAIQVARHLIGKAVKRVFRERFPDPDRRDTPQKAQTRPRSEEARGASEANPSNGPSSGVYGDLLGWFAQGHVLDIPDGLTDSEYAAHLNQAEGLKALVESHIGALESESEYGSWMGLVLEGLHQHSKLGRQDMADRHVYSDLVGSVLNGLTGGAGELDDEEDYDDEDAEDPYDR
jgi:magnesium chelatase subunit I